MKPNRGTGFTQRILLDVFTLLYRQAEISRSNMELTEKEKTVLKWVMQGKSTSEIASIMKISERTVKYHIGNVMKKLNAENRAHAVAIAIQTDCLGEACAGLKADNKEPVT